MQIGFIVILIIAIFVAIFAIQNGTPVPLDLFFVRYEMPLAVIIMVCIILGAVIVLVLGTTRQFKKRSEYKELKNKIKNFEEEKAKVSEKIQVVETEKSKAEESLKTLKSENEELKNNNSRLNTMVAELENKVAFYEEETIKLNQEANLLKTDGNKDKDLEITEITDEGVAQINNENSQVESQ
ncbi:MAG: DUF1049 domain-containing protein [Tissierellia bacterium]|nr:DUF1049 domain-containing protein [Tissierellia bacterium]